MADPERTLRREAHEQMARDLEQTARRHDATAESMVALACPDAATAYRREAASARQRAELERVLAVALR